MKRTTRAVAVAIAAAAVVAGAAYAAANALRPGLDSVVVSCGDTDCDVFATIDGAMPQERELIEMSADTIASTFTNPEYRRGIVAVEVSSPDLDWVIECPESVATLATSGALDADAIARRCPYHRYK